MSENGRVFVTESYNVKVDIICGFIFFFLFLPLLRLTKGGLRQFSYSSEEGPYRTINQFFF